MPVFGQSIDKNLKPELTAAHLKNAKAVGDDLTMLHFQNYKITAKDMQQNRERTMESEATSVYNGQTKEKNSPIKSTAHSNFGGASSVFHRPMTAQHHLKTSF